MVLYLFGRALTRGDRRVAYPGIWCNYLEARVVLSDVKFYINLILIFNNATTDNNDSDVDGYDDDGDPVT